MAAFVWALMGLTVPAAGQVVPGFLAICRAEAGVQSPSAWVARAIAATGAAQGPLTYESVERSLQDYQSDRTYEPFFSAFETLVTDFDPARGAESYRGRFMYPAMGLTPEQRSASTETAAFAFRGDQAIPTPGGRFGAMSRRRLLNPWAVLLDWEGRDTRIAGVCDYRDEGRVVLTSEGMDGAEYLFLDRESAFPVKLHRLELHPTWGQRDVEYVWSTWIAVGAGAFPAASHKLTDGLVETERTVGTMSLTDGVEMPALPEAAPMRDDPMFQSMTAIGPDTVPVADAAYLLTHRAYNEAVFAVNDTVYLFDATMNDARARQDSAWIAELYPNHRAVRLVVTDLAWPHVGGVRFWVARGAQVISHEGSRAFLERLVAREWTLAPDALESARPPGGLNFLGITGDTELAGGRVRLLPIGGIGSELALIAHLPEADFFWAGDYVQETEVRSAYATEVAAALRAADLAPRWFAAQHAALGSWHEVAALNR